MNVTPFERSPQTAAAAVPADPFDLDISVLESADGSAAVINLTDDGCRPTCKGSCATNVA
ncbi:FxLD family lanthipeptide [Streptomyces sp. Da 82-17]|uniref:FxLD family lanthipeptide n=1 Tax=Streptomyces sp. Da 82-17 TaxID=3377116 RepID=UPI0038D3B1B2